MVADEYEDPNLLLLNAMLHRMERDRCLMLARRSLSIVWLCGGGRYKRLLALAHDHHFLAKWFQHMAEYFIVINQ